MMGLQQFQPKLLINFSLESRVPEDHLLRRISEVVDFQFVRKLVRDRYSHIGTYSVDPVVIVKLVFLGYLYNVVSERKLCERAMYDMSWRWFLGYEVDEDTPTHSVLSKARARYGPHPYEEFFTRTVKLCEQAGLIAGDILYMDATMSRADASLQSLRQRGLAEQLVPVEQFLQDMWTANDNEEDHTPPRPKKPRGQGLKASGKPAHKSKSKANQELVSSTDPDAQLFRKQGVPRKLRQRTHFGTDAKANVVTVVLVRPATEHDSHVMATMLEKYKKVLGEFPQAVVGDKGFDSDAAATACINRKVLPLVMQKEVANSKAKTIRDEFSYNPERNTYVCEKGHELRPWSESFVRHETRYLPPLRTCESCASKLSCAPGRADRSITRPWHAERKETLRAILKLPSVKAILRRRGEVTERTNADAKVRHGFERAQFRGRHKMWIQAAMTAATMNIKKLVVAPALQSVPAS